MKGISVVMTVYDGERFLREALDSVLSQTMREFELIVVDDGSRDASPAILADYARRDARVRVLRQEHAGVARAANAGIAQARCEWIARTDSDDRMLPERLERQLQFLAARPDLDVACSYCHFINAGGKRIGSCTRGVDVERGTREFRPPLFMELVQSTVLMRRSAVLAAGGYRESIPYAEDRDLWGRLATSGARIACQKELLVEFRLHAGSMTMRSASVQHETCRWIDCNAVRRMRGEAELSMGEFRSWSRTRPLGERVRDAVDFASLHAFKRASRHYGEGRYVKCALTLAVAVSMNPRPMLRRLADKTRAGAMHAGSALP